MPTRTRPRRVRCAELPLMRYANLEGSTAIRCPSASSYKHRLPSLLEYRCLNRATPCTAESESGCGSALQAVGSVPRSACRPQAVGSVPRSACRPQAGSSAAADSAADPAAARSEGRRGFSAAPSGESGRTAHPLSTTPCFPREPVRRFAVVHPPENEPCSRGVFARRATITRFENLADP